MNVAIITGTRRDTRNGAAATFLTMTDPDLVIVGDASGVDREARDWAVKHGRGLLVGAATGPWPAAGPRRNAWLVAAADAFKRMGADVVFAAFPDADSKGTHDCVARLRKAGIHGGVG